MADVFNTHGEFNADDTYYEFTGDTLGITRLAEQPGAAPRLISCLGWDQYSNAKWHGAHLLVGVQCYQALIKTQYAIALRRKGLQPDGWVDFRNPTIEQTRAQQSKWQTALASHPSAG